jgi:hypothetical protein
VLENKCKNKKYPGFVPSPGKLHKEMLTLSSEAAMAQQVSVRKEANNKKNPGCPLALAKLKTK